MATTAKDLSGSSSFSTTHTDDALVVQPPRDAQEEDVRVIGKTVEGHPLKLVLLRTGEGREIWLRAGDCGIRLPGRIHAAVLPTPGRTLSHVSRSEAQCLAQEQLGVELVEDRTDLVNPSGTGRELDSPTGNDNLGLVSAATGQDEQDEDSGVPGDDESRRRLEIDQSPLLNRWTDHQDSEPTYPERELLKALEDRDESRQPAFISCPISALEEIRARHEEDHDGENVGSTAIAVYAAVGFFSSYGGETVTATVEDIASAAGCCERAARERLRLLEDLNLLDREDRETGRGRPNRWKRPVDLGNREARVPYWVPALISLSEDGPDSAALALYVAMREYVQYDDGETVDRAAQTLADAALMSRSTVKRRLPELVDVGAVERDEGRETWGNVVYLAPRTPPKTAIPQIKYLLGVIAKGGMSDLGGGMSDPRGAASVTHVLDLRVQDRNEEPNGSSTRPSVEGGAAASTGEKDKEVGQETETRDFHPPADSKGADGAKRSKIRSPNDSLLRADAVRGRSTEGGSAADAQRIRRRIREYCREHGLQIPDSEALDRVCPAVVEAVKALKDDPAELLRDLLKLLVGGEGRRRTPYWPDFLDVDDADDAAILAHVAAHARAWADHGPEGGASLADSSLHLERVIQAMIQIPAFNASKWARHAPRIVDPAAPAQVYHPRTVEIARNGDGKGLFRYGRFEVGEVDDEGSADASGEDVFVFAGHEVPIN